MRQPRLLAVANERDDRPTPQYFFDEVNREFGFTLDVAADPGNAKCSQFFSVEDDGLAQDWRGNVVWCNPPFSEIPPWLEKAVFEQRRGVLSVLLLPSATDTAWFHDLALPNAEIRFLRGRLKFGNTKGRAPFGCILAIFRPTEQS